MPNETFDPHDYVRWVQRSLNRLLEISLAVDGNDRSEPYRSAVREFNRLFLRRDFDGVDEQAQNALIRANESDSRYLTWVQLALSRALNTTSPAGIGSAAAANHLAMTNATRQLVRSFQRTQAGVQVDGFVGFRTELALMRAARAAPPGTEGAQAAAFIDQTGHPTAGDYYRTFPDEPVLPSGTLKVSTVTELSDMTVSSLLEGILASTHTNILIACHGNPNGLRVPLIEGVDRDLGGFAAELLAQWRDDSKNPEREAAVANTLGWDTWKLRPMAAFQERVKAIGNRKLGRVELRACNTGANLETLRSLRHFFASKSLTAPAVLDGYAPIDPGSATSSRTAWSDFGRRHPRRIEEGAAPNRFALAHRVGEGNTLRFSAISESSQGFRNFLDRHFIVPESFKLAAPVPGHVLLAPGKLVFPDDGDYRKNLRKVDA